MITRRERRTVFSEINITPFVDVVLVMLIIFMVTAPLMQTGIEVELPQTESKELQVREDEQFVITIKKDGTLLINKNDFTITELEQKLAALVKNKRLKDVYIKADKNVKYGVVIEVMAAVKKSGIDRMGMITQPPEPK